MVFVCLHREAEQSVASEAKWWRWGKSNPRAEGFCKEVYMRGAFLF